MIDVHTHLNFETFDGSYGDEVAKLKSKGMRVINVGTQYATSERAVHIAEKYPETCFATIGVHPIHVLDHDFYEPKFRELIVHPSVVAVGETGLDYHHFMKGHDISAFKQKQEGVLLEHMRLAKEYDKPLMIHCWDAYHELLALFHNRIDLLRDTGKPRGDIHCYIGDWKTAQKFLDLGFVIGFTGIVTFTDDEKLLEVVDEISDDQFVIETDAPYLTPVPERGKRPNTPDRVRHVAAFIAKRRGTSVEEIDRLTTATAERVFGLPPVKPVQ